MRHLQKSIIASLFILLNTFIHTQSGVIYTLSGGRFGDNILAYAQAAFIAHQHSLPLYFTPFMYSSQLALSTNRKRPPRGFQRYKKIFIEDGVLESAEPGIWYIVNYYEFMKVGQLYGAMVTDQMFAQKVREDIRPINKIPQLSLPSDCITVALHVRKTGCKWDGYFKPNPHQFYTKKDLENAVGKTIPPRTYGDQIWPLKFPPDQYYVDQLKTLSELLGDPPLYVYLFTDYPYPQQLVDRYQKQLQKTNITFSCRTSENNHDINVLEDFFAMAQQFDCLIRSASNFSWAAQFIGNHTIIFAAEHAIWIGDILVVDEASIFMRNGNTLKKMSVDCVTQKDVKDYLDETFLVKTYLFE